MCEYLDMLEKRGEKRGERRGMERQDFRWRKLILKLAEEGKQSTIIEAASDKELFERLAMEYHLW